MAAWDALRVYVNANEADDIDETYIETCWQLAEEAIDEKIAKAKRPVPEIVRHHAIVLTGANIFNMRNAKNGIQQFATPEGVNPIRLSGVVTREAILFLQPYLGRGIG